MWYFRAQTKVVLTPGTLDIILIIYNIIYIYVDHAVETSRVQ
jgi:hypothetical protein